MVKIEMPSVKERCMRAVMAGAMALTMGAGALAAPMTALAETGTVTIQQISGNETSFVAYQIFKADMDTNQTAATPDTYEASPEGTYYKHGDGSYSESWDEDTEGAYADSMYVKHEGTPAATNQDYPGTATHIEWASDAAKTATLAFLNENGYAAWLTANGHTASGAADLPQNAAAFISSKIGTGAFDADAGTQPKTPAAESFALEFAKAIAESSVASTALTDGTLTGEEGFYLVTTDPASVGDDEAATAPIWVPLGGGVTTMTEKSAIPTADKQVKEDKTATFGKAADANKGQAVAFKLTGTMPDNIGAFDAYYYKFTDTLPATLVVDTDSVVVKVGGTDVTEYEGVSVNYASNVLTIEFDDLKDVKENASAAAVAIDKDTVVTVEYEAALTSEAAMGEAGNENDVVITYTNDPVSEGTGDTTSTGVKTFTYQLDIHKVDKQTAEDLAGAKFTMQVANTPAGEPSYTADVSGTYYKHADSTYSESWDEATEGTYDGDMYVQVPGAAAVTNPDAGKYVQADGSLAATPYEFETGSDGKFNVPRIDEGTYVLHETEAPSGYELEDADITVTITSTLDQSTGELTDLQTTVSGGEAAPAGQVATHVVATSAATGKAEIQTSDDQKVVMPITGMDGVTFAVLAAGGVLVVSCAGLLRNRRKDAEEGAED